MPYRKNVFIVGAGFSAEAGAPVVRTFFEQAMELWKNPNSGLKQQERDIFRQVFDYRYELESAESKIQIDLDNIEDLFGTVEMASHLGFNGAQTVKAKIVYVILRPIELTATGRPSTGSIGFNFWVDRTRGRLLLQVTCTSSLSMSLRAGGSHRRPQA